MAMSKDRFAAKLLSAIESRGEAKGIRYVPEQFALVLEDGQFHLDNAYAEYLRAGLFSKGKVLRRWVDGTIEVIRNTLPATFEAARPHLMPYVRDVNYWHHVGLATRGLGSADELSIPFEPLGGDLTVSAALDNERTIANLGSETLVKWGVGLADVLKVGQFNLRMRSSAGFEQIHPGVWTSPYHDNYDASRITLSEVITHLVVRGDPVAFAVHRDHLFVTGAEDDEGLAFVAKRSLELIQDGRRVSGIPVCWQRGKWEPFSTRPDSVAHEPLRRLKMMAQALDYSGQKGLLEKANGEDVFVATFSIIERDPRWLCYCTWSEGVPTLLPITDLIALVGSKLDKDPRTGLYEWTDVERVCGSLMETRELFPTRAFVKEFPSSEMFAALPQPKR